MKRNSKTFLADMHIHALYDVDDGAKTPEIMGQMVDRSYEEGVRLMCLTPHFHPGYYGENRKRSQEVFEELQNYVKDRYSDLELHLANELHYDTGCVRWLEEGHCRTLEGSRYVLVDFSDNAPADRILQGIRSLMNAGYRPILAHAERYRNLDSKLEQLQELRKSGMWIQVDAGSLLGYFGFRTKYRGKRLLKKEMVDVMGSDAHDMHHRPPCLAKAYTYVTARYGKDMAEAVFYKNAKALFREFRQATGERLNVGSV